MTAALTGLPGCRRVRLPALRRSGSIAPRGPLIEAWRTRLLRLSSSHF